LRERLGGVREASRRQEAASGGFAVGCDISQGMLSQRSPADGAAATAFLAASAQALPYTADSFDAMIVTAAFHHFPAPQDALKEFRRVLRPGGMLLIADTCRDQSLGTWIWDRLHRWFEKGHVKYYHRDELRELLRGEGFSQIELQELTPSYAESKKLVGNAALFYATSPA
jgi:ubiquinone/menaquinone biosynthesis C-methylase UbiE